MQLTPEEAKEFDCPYSKIGGACTAGTCMAWEWCFDLVRKPDAPKEWPFWLKVITIRYLWEDDDYYLDCYEWVANGKGKCKLINNRS